jgi:hypothetical protein
VTGEPDVRDLLAEITSVTDAVRRKAWVAGDLAAALPEPVDPMSGLDSAGLGWLAPFVAFLREPLDQLTGNPAPVTCGAREYDRAAQDVLAAAATYRRDDRFAAALTVLGASCGAIASALSGATEVVERAARVVAGIVADAITEIVPVMTEALARSPATFGTSVAVAIPRCVGIAAAAGERIAVTLAALLASGQDLLELVAGAVAVMRVVRQVLSSLSSNPTLEENA